MDPLNSLIIMLNGEVVLLPLRTTLLYKSAVVFSLTIVLVIMEVL